MKKIFALGITILILSMAITPVNAKEVTNIVVKKEVSLSSGPYVLDDQVMIPVRSFAESQGCVASWNANKKKMTVSKNKKELYKISINSNTATLNGKKYKLNNPVESINGIAYAEAEFLNLAHKVTIEINRGGIQKYVYRFNKGSNGFEPIFADYNYDENGDYSIYEMKSDYKKIPVTNQESMGLYLASHNRSDDIFMGYVKKLSGLTPNKKYTFQIAFQLATKVESGSFGIGGSPSTSVVVKCGVTTIRPEVVLNKDEMIYRMNIDIGNQSEGGKDLVVVGDMGKPEDSTIDGFAFKTMKASVKAVTDENGCAYLVLGTDSGFEGLTEYYIDDVVVTLK